MKILFSHLKNFLNKEIDINTISESLFHLGHENKVFDNIIDIEFTPNKGDCLSIYGLARDLNALHEVNLDIDIYNGDFDKLDFSFNNEIPEFCPNISFLKVEIENPPNTYLPYMESYFENLGIKKNNFFTDISNYLAYEIGQPTHCYDFNKVKNGMSLTSLSKESNFQSLTGQRLELAVNEKVFILKDNAKVVNLAGIMGGDSTKCTDSSKIALIECAFFNPDMIIGKTVKYDINSDAAYKFERGVDVNIHDFALRRFIKIVQDHAKVISTSIKTNNYNNYTHKHISADFKKINNILGTNLGNKKIINILSKLGFEINDSIKVPSWRLDIDGINDLAEEVARVIGYDKIEKSSLELKSAVFQKNNSNKIQKIRNAFVNMGFNEVINDPFIAKGLSNSVEVDNPLDSKRRFLRLNIIDSLINNLDFNEKRQKDSIKLFEISDIYKNDKEIEVSKVISIVISGRLGNNFFNFNKRLDSHYFADLFKIIGLQNFDIKEIDRSALNSKIKNPIYYIECNVEDFQFNENNPIAARKKDLFNFNKYKAISEFPSISRDISISIENKSALEDIIHSVFNAEIKNLKDLFIFDFYQNNEKNILKIGFRFIFQSNVKTLEETEVDEEMRILFNLLLNIEGVQIPGLN